MLFNIGDQVEQIIDTKTIHKGVIGEILSCHKGTGVLNYYEVRFKTTSNTGLLRLRYENEIKAHSKMAQQSLPVQTHIPGTGPILNFKLGDLVQDLFGSSRVLKGDIGKIVRLNRFDYDVEFPYALGRGVTLVIRNDNQIVAAPSGSRYKHTQTAAPTIPYGTIRMFQHIIDKRTVQYREVHSGYFEVSANGGHWLPSGLTDWSEIEMRGKLQNFIEVKGTQPAAKTNNNVCDCPWREVYLHGCKKHA